MEAIWLLIGIVVPRYARAVRTGHQRKIPQHVLRAYHQSDAWRARKRAYWRHHPKVCVACLWLMPVAFWGWCFRWLLFPLRRMVRRLFHRDIQLHHVSYKGIWDGHILCPGGELNRHLAGLCCRLPILSRLFQGLSHHAAADRIRRLCERFGLPPVAMFRLWVLKCWTVQLVLLRLARTAIVLLWLR